MHHVLAGAVATGAFGSLGAFAAEGGSGDARYLGIAAIITAALTGLATLIAALTSAIKTLRNPGPAPTADEIAAALARLQQGKQGP